METLNMWITPALLLAALVFLWNLHREIIGLHREIADLRKDTAQQIACLLYTSPSPRDATLSRMPSSA